VNVRASRVVLGLPAFNRPDALARTLESLYSQTRLDFALVVVDDGRSDETRAVVESFARDYPHIHYEANETRLGMVGNWRKVFERARALYPDAPYFAWVSDHDLWHARWLDEMIAVLDGHPDVVLVYPEHIRMLPERSEIVRKEFDTSGVASRMVRISRSARRMLAGNMIYGLMRAEALDAAGVFRGVVTPDRQVLLALSLFGQFRHVHEVLWYREMVRAFDIERQREVFFPDGAPFYVYLPSQLQHFAVLFWDFAVLGKGRPHFGRVTGLCGALIQLWQSSLRTLTLPKSEWRLPGLGPTAPKAEP
jgi:glycosyltransferase involved in cell wall biosynthesis